MLNGAKALACPTVFGQKMEVKKGRGSEIKWQSLDKNGEAWFSAVISLFDFKCEKCTDDIVGDKLSEILTESVRLNSDFLSKWNGLKVTTTCEFPLDWGLGSSSTLIYCIAQWADVDPYELYRRSFGGSGYDIACADANGPIFYQMGEDKPDIHAADIHSMVKDHIYFIHTGRKQSTAESIKEYYQLFKKIPSTSIDEISNIGLELSKASSFDDMNELIATHEYIISDVLDRPRIKSDHFGDYWGEVKSLGAWGGDFVLATSDRDVKETKTYFENKGLDVILPWSDMIG